MRFENVRVTEDTIFYGTTEEVVVRFLENHLTCLEEEYGVEIALAYRENGEGRCLCIDYGDMDANTRQDIDRVMKSLLPALLSYGQKQYVEQQMLASRHVSDNDDELTGLFGKEYLLNRAFVLNRAEIYPTTVIAVKLKCWKSVVENYGKESGDSLVQLAASILANAADKDYLIGRMSEDTFIVLIPLVKQGETERYCKLVDEECCLYKESAFSPAFAMGIAATLTKKEDVQEKIKEAMEQLPQ